MKNLLLLELKAVFREYRQANKLSWLEMILFLFVFISITALFYVLKIFAVNKFLILNTILVLFTLLAVSSKKDYFYDFLQQKKHNILKLYPRHFLLLNLIKGIKYEFIYFLELSVILFFVFLGLIISGQAISAMIPYFIFIGLCAFTARNLSLSLYSLKISSLWYYVSIILKAVFLSANFIILSFILQWAANLQGDLFEELAKIPFIDVITGAIKFLEKNIVSFPLILAMFILAIITFLLKTSVYLFQTDSKKEQTEKLQMKWFSTLAKKVPGSESPIFHKEYKLLLDKGILSDFLKRICAYILVTVITIGFQILSGKGLIFDINLV